VMHLAEVLASTEPVVTEGEQPSAGSAAAGAGTSTTAGPPEAPQPAGEVR
jgi:hypothetical protein